MRPTPFKLQRGSVTDSDKGGVDSGRPSSPTSVEPFPSTSGGEPSSRAGSKTNYMTPASRENYDSSQSVRYRHRTKGLL